ncbi:MAG TPA: sigma 54-interacting transcriptional regulator [Methylomirabilota bacterium]|nr:sigma 54-interacting transcriptional regulator [Methylomirabilota bacterium]
MNASLFDAVVEGSLDGVCLLTADGVILRANRVALEILALPHDEVIGRPATAVFGRAGGGCSVLGDVRKQKLTVTALQTFGDGKRVLLSGTPVFDELGEIRHIVLNVRDMTGISRVMRKLQETLGPSDGDRPATAASTIRDLAAPEAVLRSAMMRAQHDKAVQYAAVDSPVLLLGETGTGKGVFARLVHQASPRSAGAFVEVNCGAIPEGLIEAELFGYVKGAFTGADSRGKAGLVELAHMGTLLLNEIGDLPIGLQVKLLRFLEDGEVWSIGAVKPKRPNVRIVAATNRDLGRMIHDGTFRGDLFYRLNVLTINIPPLREHPEDIADLVDMMLSKLELRVGRRRTFTPDALHALAAYRFPGNIRELWNIVERLVVTTHGETITTRDLPPEITQLPSPARPDDPERPTLRKARQNVEAQLLRDALSRFGTQARAAKHLGVTQSTIARKVRQYGLSDGVA